jgi:hypothetical protein
MPLDFNESAARLRDRRLRRSLLSALHLARRYGPTGELDGVTLRDVSAAGLPEAQAFEDDDHAIGLIRDLQAKELCVIQIVGLRRGARCGLANMRVKVTAKGSSLINETLPVDPDIDDERVEA